MGAYSKRVVYWEFPEDGWVFSHCERYSIAPSMEFEGEFELWHDRTFISKRKTIPLCKQDADEHELKQLKKAG